MKKFILLFFLVLGLNGVAQFSQGQIFVGGGFGFSTNSSSIQNSGNLVSDQEGTNITFSPRSGYFLSESIVAGVSLNYSRSTNNFQTNNVRSSGYDYGANLFGRKYFKLVEKLNAFTELSGGFTTGTSKREESGVTIDGPKNNSFEVGILTGLTLYTGKLVAFDMTFPLLRFNRLISKQGQGSTMSTQKYSTFQVGSDFDGLTFSILFFLNRN